MSDLATQLDRLYTLTKEAQTEPEFYMAVYQYCDLVMKNPTLRKILDASDREYGMRHSAIWRDRAQTDEEADMKADMTWHLERFNLFCDFSLLMMRIYYPLDDYIHDPAPEYKQDPVAILMMRGLKVALKYKKWSKSNLQSFNRWFEGNRSTYETNLRKFHTKMLAALWDKNAEVAPTRPRPSISFSHHSGDLYLQGVFIPFNPASQEAKVFGVLYESPEYLATYLDLIRSYRPKVEEATKSQKLDLSKIINSIKEKLGDQRDVLQNVKNVGYRLEIPTSAQNRK